MAKKKSGFMATIRKDIKESGLAKGTLSSAIITFITRLLFFVIVPVIFINLFITAAQGNSSPDAPAFIAAMQQLRLIVITFGVILSIFAGLWAYHLRHSRARLYFGIIGSVLLAVYAFMVLLTGSFSDAMAALGWQHFPTWIAFGIVAYRATRNGLMFIRDYEFFSERAKKKLAKDEKIAPYKPALGRGEFTFKIGSNASAASSAEKYIKGTITRFPFILLLIIFFLLVIGFGTTDVENQVLDVLAVMGALFLILGIPLTLLAWLRGFYPKGTQSRMIFSLGLSILFILLIYWIFVGSGLPQLITDNGIILSVYPIILAILIWAFVDVLSVGAEYRDERRKWLKSVGYDVPPKKKKRFQIKPESRFYDFNPSIGNFYRGTMGAKKEVFRLVTVPEILILLTIGSCGSAGATGPIYEIFKTWSVSLLIAGLIVAFIAFWRGYFPPGTYSRLLFGLLVAAGMLFYIRQIGLGGELDDAVKQVGVVLYMHGIQVLVVIIILFVVVLQFAEFGDSRRSWRIAVGKKVKPLKPIKKMTRLQEFRVRFANKHDGALWLRKGIVRYVFYTSIFIIILITVIWSLAYAAIGYNLMPLADSLNVIFTSLILIAIPLAACRALYGFYPGGSTPKVVFGFLMGIAGAAYTYVSFRGGNIMMTGTGQHVAAGFAVTFQFIIILFWIGWIIWGILVIAEYFAYRKAWIANDYKPVETAEEEERLKLEKIINREERRTTKLTDREKKRAARRARRRGTTVQEEEEREVAAKETGVKIEETTEVRAAEARLEAKEGAEEEEEEEEDEPDEPDAEVEAELKEEIGKNDMEASMQRSEATAKAVVEEEKKPPA